MALYGIYYFRHGAPQSWMALACQRCASGYVKPLSMSVDDCVQFLRACNRGDASAAFLHRHGGYQEYSTWALESISVNGGPPYRNAFDQFVPMISQIYAGFLK